jgi:hypothetical protein
VSSSQQFHGDISDKTDEKVVITDGKIDEVVVTDGKLNSLAKVATIKV